MSNKTVLVQCQDCCKLLFWNFVKLVILAFVYMHALVSYITCKVLLNQLQCKLGQHFIIRCLILTRRDNRNCACLAFLCNEGIGRYKLYKLLGVFTRQNMVKNLRETFLRGTTALNSRSNLVFPYYMTFLTKKAPSLLKKYFGFLKTQMRSKFQASPVWSKTF